MVFFPQYQNGDAPTKIHRDLKDGVARSLFQLRNTPDDMSRRDSPLLSMHQGRTSIVALKYGNHVFGSNWTFQQDGAKSHTHSLTQQLRSGSFSSIWDQQQRSPNSPDSNSLRHCVWDEVASKRRSLVNCARASKKVRLDAAFESCDSWTIRIS